MRTDEIHPGDVIAGKYRVRAILGRGHGLLVEGFHTEFDQRVIIKILLAGHGDDREIERFRREARTLAKLESEHVARIIDVGTEPDGSFYLVRQYLEGIDLAKYIREGGALPLVDAVLLTLQIAEALAETHANGIIVRELSPEHVFLTQRAGGAPLAKITDFGTAKLMKEAVAPGAGGDLTATAMFGLSPYSSPELVRKAKNVDVRTDVWSLGAVLYELLTGFAPFRGETAMLMLAITKETQTPVTQIRNDVPPEIDDILGWALAKDVDARFKNIHAFAHALTPYASNEGRVLIERVAQIADAAKRRKPGGSVPPPAPSFPSSRPQARPLLSEDSVTSLHVPGAPPSFRSQPPPSARSQPPVSYRSQPPPPPSSARAIRQPMTASVPPDVDAIPPPPPLPAGMGVARAKSTKGFLPALDALGIDRKILVGGLAVAAIMLPLIFVLVFVRQDHAQAEVAPPTTVFVASPPLIITAQPTVAAPAPPPPVTAAPTATATAAPSASASASAAAPEPTAEATSEPAPTSTSKTSVASRGGGGGAKRTPRPPPREAPPPAPEPRAEPAPSGDSQGTLLAIAVGGECSFSVNGASKGTSSSLRVQLKPGTYSVTCKPSDGASKSKSVTVKPGETAMAAFKLGS